jgi:hypothetical protein
MLKRMLAVVILPATLFYSSPSSAVITYANCPTLSPLPVTSFMPAAMLPIENTMTAFDVGMNVVIRNAVSAATQIQIQAINTAFNSINQSLVETSQTTQQSKIEIEREYQRMMMTYDSNLQEQKQKLEGMFFPGDEAMLPLKDGAAQTFNSESPSYRFVKSMCSAGKTMQHLTSKKVVEKALETKNRRAQKIVANVQAVSSIQAKASQSVERHFDLFCSETDVDNKLCDEASLAPNADIDAFVFMFPSGYVGESNKTDQYQTAYTYSPIESLAAYQYVKNITGSLFIPPPSNRELSDSKSIRFLAAYKQLVSTLSLSSSALLDIASNREPVNNTGLIMGALDSVNYLIETSKLPENLRILRSAGESGKLTELQKQMAIQQQIQFLILKQKDKLRQLTAADAALEATKSALDGR